MNDMTTVLDQHVQAVLNQHGGRSVHIQSVRRGDWRSRGAATKKKRRRLNWTRRSRNVAGTIARFGRVAGLTSGCNVSAFGGKAGIVSDCRHVRQRPERIFGTQIPVTTRQKVGPRDKADITLNLAMSAHDQKRLWKTLACVISRCQVF